MGERHCRVYSTLRRAQLVGVCDADLATGSRVARQYEVPHYVQPDELLSYVDAVSIATPTPWHFDLARRCLERGIHVLVEKPLTATLAQAEALTQAAEASGLVVQAGHIERFNPTYVELKNVLEDLTVLAVDWRRLSPYAGSNTDGDVISDLLVHDLDLALDLVGREPVSIAAVGLSAQTGVADHVVSVLSFEGGPLITITASRVTEQKVRAIDITALEAFVESDLLNKSIALHRRTVGEYLPHNKYRQESIVERIQVPTVEPLFLELQHFTQCILEGKPSLVPARHGLRALRLAETVRQQVAARLMLMGPVKASGRQPTGQP
jgi:predicted dehydrogenase